MLQSGVLSLALLALTGAITCPDGETCHDGSSCCLTKSGRYGCCPLARSLPMVRASSGNDGNDTFCPDGSRCPSEYSCSKSHSVFKCCPLPQGVSCSDGNHCCPEGHRCGEDGLSCIKEKAVHTGAIMCPDGVSECPDETTCCQLPDRTWGCCPLPQAVCCSDHLHCCPSGTKCDLAHDTCTSAYSQTPLVKKIPASKVVCPDKTTKCPDGNTCCRMADRRYGCCSLARAVCCDARGSVPWLEKVPPLIHSTNKAEDVPCDSTHACPDGTTCCKTESGDWACCLMPEAVCCEDHTHCCPHGTTCDVAAGSCNDAKGSVPWLEKVPPLIHSPNKAEDVPCDSTHACPDGTTCCKTESGEWACCLLPEAVCCEDHIHCCPKGTTCDAAGSTCNNATGSMPWLEKVPPLIHRPNKAEDVPCDPTHACPDGTTCCKTEHGDWACCPLPEAVCCEDHIHCCPKGTTCDAAGSTCNHASGSVPWLEKVPPLIHRPNKAEDVPCDPTHACPDGTTCCKTEHGDWACCPLPEAVCCEDHIHCCPKGTTCDAAGSTCNHARGSVPWLEKVPPLIHRPNKAEDVPCDPTHACPDGTTCCKTEHGDWACCPLPEAVCCGDMKHCCPSGYSCDPTNGSCYRSGPFRWDNLRSLFRKRLL
ncbi:hypothetical protein COCON_G00208460 [Conger conger]|uniref:Granulins domain-containing protein n=1 Tax=Conger conger TaxID=82655 RepID=A0A9Q1D042_CONCO|nr:hypothetical protein COCON_G00208460 [Conger conger]